MRGLLRMVPSLRTTPTAHLLALASMPRYSCSLPCCPWRLMQTDAARVLGMPHHALCFRFRPV